MKAILKYDLSDPDDRIAHLQAVNASNMAYALFEIIHNCHRHVTDLDDYKRKIMEAVEANDIDIDMLV